MTSKSSATGPKIATRLLRPLNDFLHREASAGILLVVAAAIAMIWANSPWAQSYDDLWHTYAKFSLGDYELKLSLKHWVNDAAMVIFFFVVGLEIKREVTQGELNDPRQAALPVIAAIGGMIVPAGIYYVLNRGTEAADGWGIPMATDIAIVMGVIALLGARVPGWLKLFMLALAIVDDIGAILVIAIFYSDGVNFAWLAVAIGAIAVAAIIRNSVNSMMVYVVLGVICWLGMFEAGIHPTLAGVAFGLLAPVTPRPQTDFLDATELNEHPSYTPALRLARQARSTVSIVEWLEHRLHPWSAFVVVPIFALANAGVKIPFDSLDVAFSSKVTWGIIGGLVVGKIVGIAGFTMIALLARVGKLPGGVTLRHVIGGAALGGIGFTVSLFVTELAFKGDELIPVSDSARLAVIIGSSLAAMIGVAVLLIGSSPVSPDVADLDDVHAADSDDDSDDNAETVDAAPAS